MILIIIIVFYARMVWATVSSHKSNFHMLHNVFHTSLVILFLLIIINLFKINDMHVTHNKLRHYSFDTLSLTFDHFQDTKRNNVDIKIQNDKKLLISFLLDITYMKHSNRHCIH